MAIQQIGSRQDKQKFWQQHVHDWEESRLSQKAYCDTNILPLQNFGYWKRKLKQSPAIETVPCDDGWPGYEETVVEF